MAISNLPVTSREYKLMLNVGRFEDRKKGTAGFLKLVEFLLDKEGAKIVPEKEPKKKERITSYLDTPELALRQKGFSLRLRDESGSGDGFQLNLKYRASDRYISAAQDLSKNGEGEIKFEEDVVPPFVSKFSHSATIESENNIRPTTMAAATALFPGLALLDIDAKTKIDTIKKFEAVEIVKRLCKFQFGNTREVKANLSFWYLPGNEESWPLVVEFSFAYETKAAKTELETYPIELVEGANRLFNSLQNQSGWVDLNGTTKTAFALEAL
jgi:uncharacterized protein YjbK